MATTDLLIAAVAVDWFRESAQQRKQKREKSLDVGVVVVVVVVVVVGLVVMSGT